MRILLIQCPAWTTESPNYALALLAGVLKQHGHEVMCLDFNIDLFRLCRDIGKRKDSIINAESWLTDWRGRVWYEEKNVLDFIGRHESYINKFVEIVLNTDIQIIGFSVQGTSKFFSLEVARRIKQRDKYRVIIFGGPLCFRNCYGKDILKDFPFLNFVCSGEGEESLPLLLNSIVNKESNKRIEGFYSRDENGKIIDAGQRQLIKNLDKVAFADYSNFPLKDYTNNILPVATSRGCINKCSFCNEAMHWARYRRRSAENITAEIKFQLERHPFIKKFWFNDSLINGDIKMLNELCDLLIAQDIRIEWGGQGMVRNGMTRDLLRKMKSAGCFMITYGIESGSNKVLKLMRKTFTAELAEQVMRDTFETGISLIFNIIVGFPGENKNDFVETKVFIQRCKKYATSIEKNTLLLLKNSFLYNRPGEFGIAPIDYNSDWQLKWQTIDTLNNYDSRRERLEELIGL